MSYLPFLRSVLGRGKELNKLIDFIEPLIYLMNMSLSSLQLDAFFSVARQGSFTRAARELSITQSALSQRIQQLELELNSTLLVREPRNIRLTEAGEKLLSYCRVRSDLEAECLRRILGSGQLAGTIRLGGYSSVLRSVLLPALSPLVQAHSDLHIEISSREIRELLPLLKRGELDYIVLNHSLELPGIAEVELGKEHDILVQPKKGKVPQDLFLDHDPEDSTTFDFLRENGSSLKKIRRNYLDDVYGILDGVGNGWGRAVVSKHLLKNFPQVVPVRGHRPRIRPVVLAFREQPIYTSLHNNTVEILVQNTPKFLV